MSTYSLFGDTTGLPKTARSKIPYEIEALSPRESWGAGNGSTALVCRQKWDGSATWIKDMVGEVRVVASLIGSLRLRRYIPEMLRYNEAGDGTDTRVQFCSIVDQTEQGGRADGGNMAQAFTNWPEVDWCKYRAVWEVFPYAILDDVNPIGSLPSMEHIAAAAGDFAGARELYRYVVRSRKTYSREQPIPAATTAGGFKVIVDPDTTPSTRKPIGQVGFKIIGMADVTYKWVRVPIGWPPPFGYVALDPANPWPPKLNPAAVDPTTIKRARDSYIGTVNNNWFDCAAPDGYCWPPGTLLYTGYDDSNRYYDAAGDWVCDVVYSFKAKMATDAIGANGGWNQFLDANGVWREVSLDGTIAGTRPYKANDFNNLFQWAPVP